MPSSFMIMRQLFDRIEDSKTGKMCDELQVEIPPYRYEEIYLVSQLLGEEVLKKAFVPGAKPLSDKPFEAMLNNSWRATLAYTGIDGMPSVLQAGNVLRKETHIKFALRLAPTYPVDQAVEVLK